MTDDLINIIWRLIYNKNRVNNEINNIDSDKEKAVNEYAHKYINIANDKVCLINDASELIDDLMGCIDVNTFNDIALKKIKSLKTVW